MSENAILLGVNREQPAADLAYLIAFKLEAMAKIILKCDDDVRQELENRSIHLNRKTSPLKLDAHTRSIQFLRGVRSRASLCLPAFYYYLGARCSENQATCEIDGPLRVARTYSNFSDLNTITLSCRKIFDHSIAGLTGAAFSKTSDLDLRRHAEFWSDNAATSVDEALSALNFLRSLFRECSKTHSQLLQKATQLQKRIGLLKQHADRSAAHLSLDDYALRIYDLAHVTAAIAVVGEIIKCFDDPTESKTYFSNIDALSRSAALRIFPHKEQLLLFNSVVIEKFARTCWTEDHSVGLESLMDKLPRIIGWD